MRREISNLLFNIFGPKDAASRIQHILDRRYLEPEDIEDLGDIACFSADTNDSKLAIRALAGIEGVFAYQVNSQIREVNKYHTDLVQCTVAALAERIDTDPHGVVKHIEKIIKYSDEEADKLFVLHALERISTDSSSMAIARIAANETNEELAAYALSLIARSDSFASVRAAAYVGHENPALAAQALEHCISVSAKFKEAADPDLSEVNRLAAKLVEETMQTEPLIALINTTDEEQHNRLRNILAQAAHIVESNGITEFYDKALKVSEQIRALEESRVEIFPK